MSFDIFSLLLKGDYESLLVCSWWLTLIFKTQKPPSTSLNPFLYHLLATAASSKEHSYLYELLLPFRECNVVRAYLRLPWQDIIPQYKAKFTASEEKVSCLLVEIYASHPQLISTKLAWKKKFPSFFSNSPSY